MNSADTVTIKRKIHIMDKKSLLMKTTALIGTIVLFIVIAYAFVPEVLSGKIVNQSETSRETGPLLSMISYSEEQDLPHISLLRCSEASS